MNSYDLEGKVAVVTGGGRGIGFAIAKTMVESGAVVALWDIDNDAASESADYLGGRKNAIAVKTDVADESSIEDALSYTNATLGPVKILVNNAGITGPTIPLANYKSDDWRKVIETNLVGTFLCCKAVAPQMAEGQWGRIVNISSVAGKEGNPNASAYSAAKAGVIALTKSLAKELINAGVIVNAITPAAVRTELFEQMEQHHIDYMLSKIPMGRFGETEEVARLAAWLCSPDCSFSTGAIFDATGGRSTY